MAIGMVRSHALKSGLGYPNAKIASPVVRHNGVNSALGSR